MNTKKYDTELNQWWRDMEKSLPVPLTETEKGLYGRAWFACCEKRDEEKRELVEALKTLSPLVGSLLSRLKFSVEQDAGILPIIRAVLAKAKGDAQEPEQYGCCCDMELGMTPDECVIDTGEISNCVHAKAGTKKADCKYWVKISEWKKQQSKGEA